ncbi:MAG: hypothetical protein AAGE52_25815 [Myxococcota bacterium]
MSKFSDFLEAQKIDPRRVLLASKAVESYTDEDQKLRLAKKRVKKNEASDAEKELATKKGRSGKPVTQLLLDQAIDGGDLTRRAKVRLLRAVNHVLKQKSKDAVAAGDLF